MSARASDRARPVLAAWGLVALLGVLVAWGPAATATAGPRIPPVVDVPANAAGACLSSGQVWLVVVTDTGATLANRCVGRPANGMAALQAAGLATTFAPGGYICTLGGYPSRCPATYDGRFWHYFHSTTGTQWTFADTGPAGYRYPASGMIDGWCYNAAGAKDCTPPRISVVAPPPSEPSQTSPQPTASKPQPSLAPSAPTTTRPATTVPRQPTQSEPAPSASAPSKTGTSKAAPSNPAASKPGTSPPAASSDSSASATTSPPSSSTPSQASNSPSTPQGTSPSITPRASLDPSAEDSQPPPVAATAPAPGTPWGVVGTGAVLVTGALAWIGWRRIRQF